MEQQYCQWHAVSSRMAAAMYLRQLLRYPLEDVVVEFPSLSEVLHVLSVLVFLTPLVRLCQVPSIGLRAET